MFKYIWYKEINEQLYTWKSALWLVLTAIIFSFSSYLFLTDKELSLLDQTELLWLLSQVILGVAFLVISIDASLSINLEFEKETIETLFLAPITLTDFIIGKLLASLTLWAAIFVLAIPYIIATSSGTHLTLAFLFYTALWGTLGVLGFLMLIFAISFIYRSSKNTLTTALVILIGLFVPALFSSTLKNNVAAQLFSKINPVDNIFSSMDNILVDYQLNLAYNWKYFSSVLIFVALSLMLLIFSAWYFQKNGTIKCE